MADVFTTKDLIVPEKASDKKKTSDKKKKD